jgi:PAS domain S-box-containing protein
MIHDISIRFRPLIFAGIVFVISAFLAFAYIDQTKISMLHENRNGLFEDLISKKSSLEKSLSSRIYYTKGVAAYVSLNPEIGELEYEKFTRKLIDNDTVIHTMSIAKNCIISAMYPRKGNEAAIGLNLLEHKARREIVEKTIETRKTFVAGPVELIEGGIAFISYTPVFVENSDSSDYFWGVNDIVINRDFLMNEVGFKKHSGNIEYALRGSDGKGANGNVFWGNGKVFDNDPVVVDVTLPTGTWVLACAPTQGWVHLVDLGGFDYFLYSCVFIFSFLIWLLSTAWMRISTNEAKLKAIFGSMHDVIIEFDNHCVYRSIAPTNEELLIRPPKELLGKSVFEVFSSDAAKNFQDNILECFKTKKVVNMDYPIMIDGDSKWFSARINYISKTRCLFVAHDNTEKKFATSKLVKSEARLKELNAMKDKFFAIIAHDLKNPLGTYMALTEMLFKDYDSISTFEKKSILKQLVSSAKTLYSLLENLLDWSRSQRGKLPYNPEVNDLHFAAENVKSVLKLTADSKQIEIINKVAEYTLAYFDANMIITVLRNLVSNALKYTNDQGKVKINVEYNKEMTFAKMSVCDDGIGISKDNIEKLFKVDESVSTPGTNEEQGTGLGLILCKEFVNKNRGDIWVESIEGKGAEFFFTIPLNPEDL